MSAPQFVPGPHPSHDWHGFEEGEPSENRFCHRCEICTCHSPVASTEPCENADPTPTDEVRS